MVRLGALEAKLRKQQESNEKLKDQLDIPRMPVSAACNKLIEHCQQTTDMMLPSIWGPRGSDPYGELNHGGCHCILM